MKHGAKRSTCRHEGCTNHVVKAEVCIKHGEKPKRKKCRHDGCTKYVVHGGVCIKHGAKRSKCRSEGCTNKIIKGGVCIKHGAKVNRSTSLPFTASARDPAGYDGNRGEREGAVAGEGELASWKNSDMNHGGDHDAVIADKTTGASEAESRGNRASDLETVPAKRKIPAEDGKGSGPPTPSRKKCRHDGCTNNAQQR